MTSKQMNSFVTGIFMTAAGLLCATICILHIYHHNTIYAIMTGTFAFVDLVFGIVNLFVVFKRPDLLDNKS